MYFEKKNLNKLVKSLQLIAENDPALGFCQPQNNAEQEIQGLALSHYNKLPTSTGYKGKKVTSSESDWIDFCLLVDVHRISFKAMCIAVPLDFVESQLHSPLS